MPLPCKACLCSLQRRGLRLDVSMEVLGQSAVPLRRAVRHFQAPGELGVDMIASQHRNLHINDPDVEFVEGEDPEDLNLGCLGIHRHVVNDGGFPQPCRGQYVLQCAALGGELVLRTLALDQHSRCTTLTIVSAAVLLDVGLYGVFLEGHRNIPWPAPDAIADQLAVWPVCVEVRNPIRVRLSTNTMPPQATLEEEGVGQVDWMEGPDVHEDTAPLGFPTLIGREV
mmetsp:Transcript_102155/g.329524  ORF Transcript_102155/g.329524 Transcript_102155/m.329524 type:complete len:226 (-) Transcript_102155:792-1469(-)